VTDPDGFSLPGPLAVAVTEFEAWMQGELRTHEARSKPETALYHYTDFKALCGIIRTRRLWCFLHRQQSDASELQFGLDIAKRVVLVLATHNPVVAILHGLHGMLDLHTINKIFEFYVFSLCGHRDNRCQWELYGRTGCGYSIGFAPKLLQPSQPALLPQADHNVFVSKVIYGCYETCRQHRRTVEKLADIVDRTFRANRQLLCGKLGHPWFDAMNRAALTHQLIWNSLTAKAASFENERETRYVRRRSGGVRSLPQKAR